MEIYIHKYIIFMQCFKTFINVYDLIYIFKTMFIQSDSEDKNYKRNIYETFQNITFWISW